MFLLPFKSMDEPYLCARLSRSRPPCNDGFYPPSAPDQLDWTEDSNEIFFCNTGENPILPGQWMWWLKQMGVRRCLHQQSLPGKTLTVNTNNNYTQARFILKKIA